jgi:predicted MFS family arabinose efflux permease
LIPALLALSVLLLGRLSYPNPRDFELELPAVDEAAGLPKSFWLYLGGAALIAAAYADFPLIAFHFKDASVGADTWVPLLYAAAMGMDAVAALGLGRLFDRAGIPALLAAFAVSAFFPVLVFSSSLALVLLGALCWGVGMGAQESVMRAVVARLTPPDRRASAFGVFNFGFGVPWFLGSALMGLLYDQSVTALIVFSTSLQVMGVLWLFVLRSRLRPRRAQVAEP